MNYPRALNTGIWALLYKLNLHVIDLCLKNIVRPKQHDNIIANTFYRG